MKSAETSWPSPGPAVAAWGLGLLHALVDTASLAVLYYEVYLFGQPGEARFSAGELVSLILLYNVLAFGLQAPLGWFADLLAAHKPFAAGGLALTALAVAASPHWAYAGAIVVGVGNACFHVGAGGIVLRDCGGRAARPGIFVAPGAMGVALGIALGLAGFPYRAALAATAAACAVLMVLVRLSPSRVADVPSASFVSSSSSSPPLVSPLEQKRAACSGETVVHVRSTDTLDNENTVLVAEVAQNAQNGKYRNEGKNTEREPTSLFLSQRSHRPQRLNRIGIFRTETARTTTARNGEDADRMSAAHAGETPAPQSHGPAKAVFAICVFFLLLSVSLRSQVGGAVRGGWPEQTGAVALALAGAAVVGKLFGGVLADRLGWRKVGVGALLLAAPLVWAGAGAGISLESLGAWFAPRSPAFLMIDTLLIQLTMALTLTGIYLAMPRHPGLTFGLASAALLIGAEAPKLTRHFSIDLVPWLPPLILASAVMIYFSLTLLVAPPSPLGGGEAHRTQDTPKRTWGCHRNWP